MNICIVAGEASGDVQAAHLLRALRPALLRSMGGRTGEGTQRIHFWGVAGPCLRAEGVEPLLESEDLAVMGFAEVVAHYPRISGAYKTLLKALERRRPDAVIFVDYPGFNLKLAQDAYALGLTVLYHIAPKAWAHGAARARILRDCTHLTTCILPFEKDWLRERGVPAEFIGNPLRDAVDDYVRRNPGKRTLTSGDVTLGLLPGSRRAEIGMVLPLLVHALAGLQARTPLRVGALCPVAATLDLAWVKSVAHAAALTAGRDKAWCESTLKFVQGSTYDVMANVDYAWVCSGTATLETAFFGTPLSVVYKMNAASFAIAKRLIRVPWVSLVNLCAQETLVPEFLQGDATTERLVAHAIEHMVAGDARTRLVARLLALRDLFPVGSAARATEIMVRTIDRYAGDAAVRHRLHRSGLPPSATGGRRP